MMFFMGVGKGKDFHEETSWSEEGNVNEVGTVDGNEDVRLMESSNLIAEVSRILRRHPNDVKINVQTYSISGVPREVLKRSKIFDPSLNFRNVLPTKSEASFLRATVVVVDPVQKMHRHFLRRFF